jgi:hypothetical protein
MSLKECPFCGWPAVIKDMGLRRYHVQCTNCLARLGETWGSDELIADLERFWNSREQDVTVSEIILQEDEISLVDEQGNIKIIKIGTVG